MGSKKELNKIIEKLLNARVQNQPLALAVPEEQITRSHYVTLESQSCPVFCTFFQSTHNWPLSEEGAWLFIDWV